MEHLSRSMHSMDMHSTSSMDQDSFCIGTGVVMQKGFQVSYSGGSCVLWLFQGALVDTKGKYAAAVIGTFILAFIIEMIRWGRFLLLQYKYSSSASSIHNLMRRELPASFLFGIQMTVAYWIMLLVMLYETVFFLAIVSGLMLGHFLYNFLSHRMKEHARAESSAPNIMKP